MKKNKIFNLLCCLFCLYGCSDCDNAELVDGSSGDKHENYTISVGAYDRDRAFIEQCCKMGGKTVDLDKVLPSGTDLEKYQKKIEGYFYVNNNIVLSQLFYRMAIMKIKFGLLIEKLGTDDQAGLQKDLNTSFDEAKAAINSILATLKTPGQEGLENQAIYDKIKDLDKAIEDKVHKVWIPRIIEIIQNDTSLLDKIKISTADLKNYHDKPTIGIESILLSQLYDKHEDFHRELTTKFLNLPKMQALS